MPLTARIVALMFSTVPFSAVTASNPSSCTRGPAFFQDYGFCQAATVEPSVMAKNTPNSRHVVPHKAGGWDVTKPGATRASAHYETQGDAIRRARQILHNSGGGELNVHGRDGRIRDKD